MLFNSVDFAIFLPIVFTIYWLLNRQKLKVQNLFLIVASYTFYGWWDWRFLTLILFSTVVDYTVGKRLNAETKTVKRKTLLWTSIITNLGLLVFFKYHDFFLQNFIAAFSFFGTKIEANSLNIILPVGISFYTFQTLSYTIDLYKKKIEPSPDFVSFAAFVAFFPQLVAGPIERASNLLTQFYEKRSFIQAKAVDGLRQILWGLFKKVVIADNCSKFANDIFENSAELSGSTLLLGALFFTFQIYGDFSGYSDIAIGTSRLFGFNLRQNFAFPYFSRDIAEFWRRWHISLSTWFRDYLYIPLGGSREKLAKTVRNVFIIFLVSGFWHGANWTFVAWGALNAIYFLPLLLSGQNRQNLGTIAEGKSLPSIKELLSVSVTFLLTVLAWIFFRAENLEHAFSYLNGLFSVSIFSMPQFSPGMFQTIGLLFFFVVVEWIGRFNLYAIEKLLLESRRGTRVLFYIFLCVIIFLFMGKQEQFIYFQF